MGLLKIHKQDASLMLVAFGLEQQSTISEATEIKKMSGYSGRIFGAFWTT